MTINAVFWNNAEGFDLHVFPNAPPQPLDALLGVTANGSSHFGNDLPAGITVQFIGEFAGAPSSHGVLVGPNTGTITVSNPRPPLQLNNFLIRAEVKEGGVVFADTPRIRVHVHDRIVFNGVWLTPDTLSIHNGSDGQRLSVLAQFDDDVIGDISNFPGLQWQSADDTVIHVDPDTGALTAKVDSGSQPITVTLPAPFNALQASATVKALPPWKTAATATHVSGPGAAAAATVPNFLFIPEGFGAGDKDAFADMVKKVIGFLDRDTRTSPFNLLKNKINYWMTWIESPQKGASVLHDVAGFTRGTQLLGKALPLARAPKPPPVPPAVAPIWDLDELVHEVGYPIPAEAIPPGSSDVVVGALFVLRSAGWSTLFGNKVNGRVDVDLYRAWADVADRRAIDERNSALGLSVGSRPNHRDPTVSRGVGLNPRRTTRAHLDDFLQLLTDGASPPTPIGIHWGSAGGKDRQFVFALVAGTRRAGMQSEVGLVASSVRSDLDVKLTSKGVRRVAIDPYKIPSQPSLDATLTVAHESGHAFGLGDEYGQVGTIPAADLAAKGKALNLQDEASLLAPPQPPLLTGLDGRKLKWLWPRIAKAAVLTGAPVPSGTGFEIPIDAQPAPPIEPFKEGDVVQVRARPLTKGIVPSDPFKIKLGGSLPKKLLVEPVSTPIAVSPAGFGADAVVYAPTIDPLPMGTGKPLMLVHDKVRDHITTTGLPLNAPSGATLQRVCGDEGPAPINAQQGTNLPPTLALPKGGFSHWVVGAFEGGGEYQCGVYHPTGACLMRANVFREIVFTFHIGSATMTNDSQDLAYTLCPVCRYIMVDKLDPTLHGAVDKWYRNRYPG